MFNRIRFVAFCGAVCALSGMLSSQASGGTILKLGLGSDPPADIEFDGITLSTVDDGNAGSLGDQNTAVEFQDFLDGFADILTPIASFTLDGLVTDGPASVFFGSLVVQPFTGGSLALYDPSNVLLLSATLDASVLTGALGPPATGALFTTSFSTVTGGTLAPYIDLDTLTLSMSLTNIDAGGGLSVTEEELDPFVADVTLNIAAEQVPEPASVVLLLVGAALAAFWTAWRSVDRAMR